jgi:2-haloacid dehalogenase
MVAGEIDGAVPLLEELKDAGHELHALTNWSGETFPIARERFAFLDWFETILVSAEVGLIKPDPAIFKLLLARIGRTPAECVYIDDNARNVVAATRLGFDAITFEGVARLRAALEHRGLLAGRREQG